MTEEIFGIGGMVFVLIILSLIVVVISQVLKFYRAKITSTVEIARDEAYRKLAEEAISVQQKIAEDQQRIIKNLSEMKERINAMDKMLREVE